jgi:GNAT superfamily N-acetyltransferase
MDSAPRRRPFDTQDIERVLSFCADHPASDLPTTLRRRFLTTLTSSTEGVVELTANDGAVVIAVVIDEIESDADCAVMELLAVREGPSLPALLATALDAAEPFVRGGARSGIEAPVQPGQTAWGALLQSRSYHHAFTSYDMETAAREPPPTPPLPGPEWRWERAHVGHAIPYYASLQAAMAGIPGFYPSSFEKFRERLGQPGGLDTVLLCGARVAGFACGVIKHADLGYISLIGRHPRFRGQGLGEILLAYTMGALAELGAVRYGLDVTASNAGAIDLYQRHGFEVEQSVPVYRALLSD